MREPREAIVEVKGVTLSVGDDLDGSGLALRGWLTSAGAGAGWEVLAPAPSEGQGVSGHVVLAIESSVGLLELYDRVRLWISHRRTEAKPVTAVTAVEVDGKPYQLVVTLNPLEDSIRKDRGGRAS
jgi:hypothetical protein